MIAAIGPAGGPLPDRPRADDGRFDLLRVPLIGPFLKWPWSRVALQIPMALLSLVMVLHALLGPDLAPKNLGTLLTWVHFRGMVVLTLLCAGNFFCMACPFMLPRALARRLVTPRLLWPRAFRNKWPSIALFIAILFAYENFALWSDPWWTGVLIAAYFAAALLIDVLFQHAAFCKFVCPIGQFNFLGSTISPLEVAVRDLDTCATCRTGDCLRGRRVAPANGTSAPPSPRHPRAAEPTLAPSARRPPALRPAIVQRGCELALFQPMKVGSLDCTFCMDCVYACPHDNIGLLARLPAQTLAHEGSRSGVGRPGRQFDWTVLIVVFTFGALLNALAMVSPVYALERSIAHATGLHTRWPVLALLFLAMLVLLPAVLLFAAAAAARAANEFLPSALAQGALSADTTVAGAPPAGALPAGAPVAGTFPTDTLPADRSLAGRSSASMSSTGSASAGSTGAGSAGAGRSLAGNSSVDTSLRATSVAGLFAVVSRFSVCLVPFGFGVWLAHYGFHFLTGLLTVIPVTQNAVLSIAGWPVLGEPLWRLAGLPPRIVLPLEISFLLLGFLGSLLVALQIAAGFAGARWRRAFAPWAAVLAALLAGACWIMLQPMDMRGTFLGG